jgi:uncharacterized protein (DUF697 family)
MKRETWLGLYDKLTALVEKLPGGLQKPILSELMPIRRTFLEARPARLMIVGPEGSAIPEALLPLYGGRALHAGGSEGGWRHYETEKDIHVHILDARSDVPDSWVKAALAAQTPDAVLIYTGLMDEPNLDSSALRIDPLPSGVPVAIIFQGLAPGKKAWEAAFRSHRALSSRNPQILDGTNSEEMADGICRVLPDQARLDFARMTGAQKARVRIARSLLKSFTAVCGVIAVQPIPLADLPILVALQTLMVALIIHTSGRKANFRLVVEFLTALGANIGAGLLFREGARTLLKIVPVWGHAISGVVAGAGTYAIGRAAIAYFIGEVPLSQAKSIFQKLLPGKKEAQLPEP